MKNTIIILLGIFLISCGQATDSAKSNGQEEKVDTSAIKKVHYQLAKSDLEKSIFEYGSKDHFKDSCSFDFACDCCSGKIIFNSDSTFFYVDYCMSDQTVSKGTYTIDDNMLHLQYGAFCVSRKYNYENEVDTSAIDYFMTDTTVSKTQLDFAISKCDDKIMLTDEVNEYYGLETQSSYNDMMKYMEKERFIERFDELEE